MISVAQALQTLSNTRRDFGTVEVPFLTAVGGVLKEDIFADRDFPPFDRVAMDGIAIDFNSFKNGQRSFLIEGVQPAGSAPISLQNSQNCIEVMTGAVLPNGANAVIRYEDVRIANGKATITIDALANKQNIHQKGKDKLKGALLIAKNTVITSAEIGVLATVGKSLVKVAKPPKVLIVSTGDELVEVAKTPLGHQIRRSNVFTLVSLLESLKIASEITHITDDKAIVKQKVAGFLQAYDVLLFSGAVSKGKFDFLPEVFEELGVEKLFHQVAQRPGKPFFYGKTATCNVFGFPGNPISTFVNCLLYFYPWYYQSVGLPIKEANAILAEDVVFTPNLTYFLQVKLSYRFGHLIATPVQGNGSGDLASLAIADAFIELPKEQSVFKAGEVYSIIKYR